MRLSVACDGRVVSESRQFEYRVHHQLQRQHSDTDCAGITGSTTHYLLSL